VSDYTFPEFLPSLFLFHFSVLDCIFPRFSYLFTRQYVIMALQVSTRDRINAISRCVGRVSRSWESATF